MRLTPLLYLMLGVFLIATFAFLQWYFPALQAQLENDGEVMSVPLKTLVSLGTTLGPIRWVVGAVGVVAIAVAIIGVAVGRARNE